MEKNIKTESVRWGVAKTNPILLDASPETKIQFHSMVHEEGVSGSIFKFRKDRRSDWEIFYSIILLIFMSIFNAWLFGDMAV